MPIPQDLSSFTASSWGMLRKLLPFTSRIWSPTCGVRPSIKADSQQRTRQTPQTTIFPTIDSGKTSHSLQALSALNQLSENC
uniref:Uncharacterized protein n=1 Tax=Apteryx owenii TaxID=8824 RepID=A0A8B9S9Z8_APTOW